VKMKSAYIYILHSKFFMVKLGLIKLQQYFKEFQK
jgi:hypothetical protein